MEVKIGEGESLALRAGDRLFMVTAIKTVEGSTGLSIRSEDWVGGYFGYRPMLSELYSGGERAFVKEDMSANKFSERKHS